MARKTRRINLPHLAPITIRIPARDIAAARKQARGAKTTTTAVLRDAVVAGLPSIVNPPDLSITVRGADTVVTISGDVFFGRLVSAEDVDPRELRDHRTEESIDYDCEGWDPDNPPEKFESKWATEVRHGSVVLGWAWHAPIQSTTWATRDVTNYDPPGPEARLSGMLQIIAQFRM